MNTPYTNTETASKLLHALQQRILMLDGAMGTMIQRQGLKESDYHGERFTGWDVNLKGMNDLLVLTRPDVIGGIHEQYLEAGADIIETNSFNATPSDLARYNLSDYAHEINLAAARVARQAVDRYSTTDKPRFVAGVLGPNQKTSSVSVDVNDPGARAITFDELVKDYSLIAKTKNGDVRLVDVKGNYQRLCRHNFDKIKISAIRLHIHSTNGAEEARVYEVRCYA